MRSRGGRLSARPARSGRLPGRIDGSPAKLATPGCGRAAWHPLGPRRWPAFFKSCSKPHPYWRPRSMQVWMRNCPLRQVHFPLAAKDRMQPPASLERAVWLCREKYAIQAAIPRTSQRPRRDLGSPAPARSSKSLPGLVRLEATGPTSPLPYTSTSSRAGKGPKSGASPGAATLGTHSPGRRRPSADLEFADRPPLRPCSLWAAPPRPICLLLS